jgi:hypothetical protein
VGVVLPPVESGEMELLGVCLFSWNGVGAMVDLRACGLYQASPEASMGRNESVTMNPYVLEEMSG